MVEPSVDVDRFSYPLSAGSFAAVQVWFGIHHLGLLAGLLALRWAGALPDTRPARWGWATAVIGMAGLAVTEVVAIAAADADVDSGIVAALGGLYGVTCLAMGVGLILAGVSIWRAQVWEGWRRGVVLALGVWVFVPMFPALIVTPTDGARLAISRLDAALRRAGGGAAQPCAASSRAARLRSAPTAGTDTAVAATPSGPSAWMRNR